MNRLTEIFQNFHLYDFRNEINFWQELALCNDQSAYDEGCTREDLMNFIQELHKMIEAFHVDCTNKITMLEAKLAGSSQAEKSIDGLLDQAVSNLCRLDTMLKREL